MTISKWLLHDDQKELFEILVAIALNLLFLTLIALLLWSLGKLTLAFRIAKGYDILWIAIFMTAVLIGRIQYFFRVNLYDHSDIYVISNLAASCFLQVGWAAFAALTIQSFLPETSVWIMAILYLIGFFFVSRFLLYSIFVLPGAYLQTGQFAIGIGQLPCFQCMACQRSRIIWMVLRSFLKSIINPVSSSIRQRRRP